MIFLKSSIGSRPSFKICLCLPPNHQFPFDMLKLEPIFKDHPSVVQLVVLFLIVLCCWLISFFAGVVLARLIFGVPVLETLSSIGTPDTRLEINLMKFLQMMNQLGAFVIPGFLFAFLVSPRISDYLGLRRIPGLFGILSVVLLMYLLLPLINELVRLNQGLSLPAGLGAVEEWMRNSEKKAEELTEAFLRTTSFTGLLINLLIVGVLASVGEELLFRAVLIRLFRSWFGNVHWAVVVSAFIFSAFHLQFYGFLPRFLLGLIFGYLFVWSGSLWLPIIAHFINNSSAVVVYFLVNRGAIDVSVDDFGSVQSPALLTISVLLSMALLFFIFMNEKAGLRFMKRKDGFHDST